MFAEGKVDFKDDINKRGAHGRRNFATPRRSSTVHRSSSTNKTSASSARKNRNAAPEYRTRSKASSGLTQKAASASKTAAKPATRGTRAAAPAAKRGSAASGTSQRQRNSATASTRKKAGASSAAPARKMSAARKPTTGAASASSRQRTRAASNSAQLSRAKATKPAAIGTSASKSGAKAPSARTESNGSFFKHFFLSHLKVCAPVALLIVAFLCGGVFDVVSSFGKIHPGVKVMGVEIGGMSKEDASAKLSEQLSSYLEDAEVIVYADEETAQSDGASMANSLGASSDSLVETAEAEELSGSDVTGNGKDDKWKLSCETVGAYINGDAIAEEAFLVGREGNFIGDRIAAWMGNFSVEPKLGYSQELLNNLSDEINDACGTTIKDCKITVSSGQASVVEGRDGYLVDEQALCDSIATAVFSSEGNAIVVPMSTVSMNIKPATAQRVADQVTQALSQDVTITYKKKTWTMDNKDLGDMLSQTVLKPTQYLAIGNGTQKKQTIPTGDDAEEFSLPYDTSAGLDDDSQYTLQCYVNQKKFDSYLVDILGSAAKGGATNAKFDTSSGDTVTIKPSKDGKGPDRNAAALQLQDMLFGADSSRTIALTDTTIKPERTTEDAEAMGIKERLATWSIPMSGTASRQKNIKTLCKLIDGSIVEPGGTWSFNETTGERTEEKGFEKAAVIVNGKHEDQLGGGVCQVATCVFNAVCYSGLGIVTRTNHDFYIPAYDDEGFADATVSWEQPDFAFLNDMSTYVMLTATADSENVTVSMWGTKDGRTIECKRGEWKAGTKYKTIKENDDELPKGTTQVTQSGVDGRSINIRYIVTSADGETLHDITFHSIYQAQNEIIKVGTKTSSSDKESSKKSSESDSDN